MTEIFRKKGRDLAWKLQVYARQDTFWQGEDHEIIKSK